MCGKRIKNIFEACPPKAGGLQLLLLGYIILLVPLQLVASKEAGGRMLTFSAQPVSTADLRNEWKDYKQKYVMLYSFGYALALLK